MNTRKSCGITTHKKKIIIFHGKETVSFSIDDSDSLSKAQDLLWKIANDAQTVGQEQTKFQIKELLGINLAG